MYFFLQEDNANQHRHSILLSCQDPCGTTLPGPRSHLHNSRLPSIPKHPCHLPLLTRVHPCLRSLQRTNFLTTFAVSSFVRPEKIPKTLWGIRCFNQRLRTEEPATLSAAIQECFGSSLSSHSG